MQHETEQAQEPQVIEVGERVRSYDFPERERSAEGPGACYVEGVVVEIRTFPEYGMADCPRYRIRVDRRVWGGREAPVEERHYVHPPVNGTPTLLGRVCDGVELLEVSHCEGCEEGVEPNPELVTEWYLATFRIEGGGRLTKRVRWCRSCVELARVNFTGHVLAVHDLAPGER